MLVNNLKRFCKIWLYMLVLQTSAWYTTNAQTDKAISISIARFYNDRSGAISYTFDDGIQDQYELAYPMLKKNKIPATFFIIPSKIQEGQKEKSGSWGGISWDRLKEMSNAGYEIASHSWSHPNLKKLNDEQLQDEITKADTSIYRHLGFMPLTFAYPYNSFDDRVHTAVMKQHIASRDYQQAFGNPKFTLAFANNWADKQIKNHTWGIAMIHAIKNGFDSFTSPAILQDHLMYVSRLSDELWIDTFGNISLYTQERDSTAVSFEETAVKQIRCHLQTKLNNAIYRFPLTLIVQIPEIKNAAVTQAGKKISFKKQGDKIYFNVIPGSPDIKIKWQ